LAVRTRVATLAPYARSDFALERSDLDFVVEFDELPSVELANAFFELKDGLETLFQRPVDLVVERAIRNPYFKASVERDRQPVHAG
jgi:predicted nucleotidyltransferase